MTKLKNIVVAIASIVVFTNITYAQAVKANYAVNYEEPLAVKYIGNDGDYLTFQVTVQSENTAKAVLEIEDSNEGELYSSYITPKYKVQMVKIEKRGDQVLNFRLRVDRKSYSKTFSINTKRVGTTTVVALL